MPQDRDARVVGDWQISKHAQNGVDCAVCHGEGRQSAADAAKVSIPTPETCTSCHEQRVAQFKSGNHPLAWAAMRGCGGRQKFGLKCEEEIRAL